MAEPKTKIPCEFEFEALPEDCSPHDSCDDEVAEQIIKECDSGNEAAWFIAKVTCVGPLGFKGVAYLGGCSYNNFKEFTDDAYYADMCGEAYEDMLRCVREAVKRGEAAKEVLAEYGEKE